MLKELTFHCRHLVYHNSSNSDIRDYKYCTIIIIDLCNFTILWLTWLRKSTKILITIITKILMVTHIYEHEITVKIKYTKSHMYIKYTYI